MQGGKSSNWMGSTFCSASATSGQTPCHSMKWSAKTKVPGEVLKVCSPTHRICACHAFDCLGDCHNWTKQNL
eukprot:1473385-Amphidinium_carterae.1